MGALFAAEVPEGEFDAFAPSNISPLVAYLAAADCKLTGKVYAVQGGAITELAGWHGVNTIESEVPGPPPTSQNVCKRMARNAYELGLG